MRFHYDKSQDALYIRFDEKRYAGSDEVAEGIIFDYDKAGKIIGIEILGASKVLPRRFHHQLSQRRLPAALTLEKVAAVK
jgi:uncharacterized protein YuzE